MMMMVEVMMVMVMVRMMMVEIMMVMVMVGMMIILIMVTPPYRKE